MHSQNNRNVQAKCLKHDVRPTSAAKRCDAREESGTQQVRAFPPHEAETQAPCGCAEKLRRGVGRRSECSFRCGNCGYAHVTSQTRSMNAFPGSVRRRLLAKPGRWRHHRHNLVNRAVCSLGGYPVFHHPKEEEDNVLMDNRPFYTRHESITE